MPSSSLRIAALLTVALILTPACKYFRRGDDVDLRQANELAEEAGGLASDVRKATEEAAGKEEQIRAERRDAARLKKLNEELISIYDRAIDAARKASEKYEEAAKLKIDSKYLEYLRLRGQEMRKHGAYLAALKEGPAARIDPKTRGRRAQREKASDLKTRAERLKKEVEELKAEADRIEKESGEKFKAKS